MGLFSSKSSENRSSNRSNGVDQVEMGADKESAAADAKIGGGVDKTGVPPDDPEETPPTLVNKNNRHCTDILFLILFIASWGVLGYVYGVAFQRGGNYFRLLRGVDYNGNICGIDANVSSLPFTIWPAIFPIEGLTLKQQYDIKMCAESCDASSTDARMYIPYPSKKVYKYCVPDLTGLSNSSFSSFNISLDSFDSASFAKDQLQQVGGILTQLIGNLISSWTLILSSCGITVLLAIFYIILCHKFAKFLVWMTIFFVVGGIFTCAYFLIDYSYDGFDQNTSDEIVRLTKSLGFLLLAIGEALLIFILLGRKRILIAVEIIRETSKALFDMKWIFGLPIFFSLFSAGYFALFVAGILFIFSIRVPDGEPFALPSILSSRLGISTYEDQDWDHTMRNQAFYALFHMLWVMNFCIYLEYLTISGALADWYFTRTNEKGKKIRGNNDDELSTTPIWSSFYRSVRYHLGTVAFSSLIIAIVEFLRAVVTYLERNVINGDNFLKKIVFAIMQCFLKCLQCIVDKLSRKALVYCSIYGTNLCKSGVRSFFIVWRNLGSVAALSLVSEFLLTFGKLAVACGTSGISFLLVSRTTLFPEVNSFIIPGLIIFIISYIIADQIMEIYEASIDCIFFCFCVDLEKNGNGNMLAGQGLRDLVEKNKKRSKKIALESADWKTQYGSIGSEARASRLSSVDS